MDCVSDLGKYPQLWSENAPCNVTESNPSGGFASKYTTIKQPRDAPNPCSDAGVTMSVMGLPTGVQCTAKTLILLANETASTSTTCPFDSETHFKS